MNKIIPEKLKKGDEIRVIAPSRSMNILSEETISLATKRLEDLGFIITFGKNVKNEIDSNFCCASIKDRVEDLHDAFKDKNVKAILTVIGGFNINQILDYVDYDLIKNNPKIICGYSDITALLNAIYAKTGLVTYCGPFYSSFGMKKGFEYTLEYFKKIFMLNGKEVDKKIITNYYYDIEKDFSLIPRDKIYDTMLYSYINFGCPNDCKYCVEHKFVDKIAFNTLDNKFNEIKQLVNDYGVKFVHIADSDFLIHRETIEQFIKFIKNENLNCCFSINTSPYIISKYINDPIMYDLKDIGLVEILIGAEHFSKKVLKNLSKNYDIEEFEKSLNYVKNIVKIPIVSLYTLVGLPGEYEEDIAENLSILEGFKKNNLFDFTFPKFFVPYPDSDIYLHPEKYNVIIKNENWDEYQRWQLPRPIIIRGMTDQQYVDEMIEINRISMEDYENENYCGRSLYKKR